MSHETAYYINLYPEPLRPKRSWLTGQLVVNVIVLFAVLTVGYHLFLDFQLIVLGKQLSQTQAQYQQNAAELESSRALQAQLTEDRSATEANSQLKRLYLEKKAQFDALTAIASGNSTGFSVFMESLSRQWQPGMWLEKLSFVDGGEVITLSGKTTNASAVSEFLTRIGREKVFDNLDFKDVSLRTDSENILTFSLSSNPLGKKTEKAPEQDSTPITATEAESETASGALGEVFRNMQRLQKGEL